MSFKEIDIRDVKESVVKMINDDWMLITAGDKDGWNTMTASWGAVGELWNKDVVFAFIRPTRYTREFVEKNDLFTLSFFGGKYKKELGVCGSKSGRDIDKSEETGLLPEFIDGTTCIKQAETVLICRKVAIHDMVPSEFLDKTIENNYSKKDYHRVYVGEIIKTLQSK